MMKSIVDIVESSTDPIVRVFKSNGISNSAEISLQDSSIERSKLTDDISFVDMSRVIASCDKYGVCKDRKTADIKKKMCDKTVKTVERYFNSYKSQSGEKALVAVSMSRMQKGSSTDPWGHILVSVQYVGKTGSLIRSESEEYMFY